MTRRKYPAIKSVAKVLAIVLGCSVILAIPMVKLTMDWSRSVSRQLYGAVTGVLRTHSPGIIKIDENGVPIADYGYQMGEYLGPQRNPLTIATKATSYFDQYSSAGNPVKKDYFLNCIRWLAEAEKDRGAYSLWAYEFDVRPYNLKAPYYSAMAQTRIMVAFERAYELTKDQRYELLSLKAMRSLEVPIGDGGVLHVDPRDGGSWYEELASDTIKPPLILNGFIFSLLDLNDVFVRTGSQEAKTLFDNGVVELKRHLADFDTGRWTYYDMEGELAYDYHYVHIDQMRQLYDITGQAIFKAYHDKWASYFPWNPMWARERFAAYLLDVTIIFIGSSITILLVYGLTRRRSREK